MRQTIVKMSLLLSKHVDTAINCSGVGELIRPLLLWIDVHVLGKQVGQLIVFFHEGLLIVGAGGETRGNVEGGAGSSSVGHTDHRGGTNTAGAEARKKGSAMTGLGGGHGQRSRWVEGRELEGWTR